MKRFLVLMMIFGLVVGSVATAEAKKKKAPKPYTMTGTYDQPAIGTAGVGLAAGGLSFVSSATNTYMSIKIEDGVSPMPYGDFSWDTDGDGVSDTGVTVCGPEAKDLQVPPNTTITVFMWALPSPFCAGFSTSGTVTATFSATPSS
ncbi:MAG: hypothetical protein QOG04_1383 [Actinomycetota bacterium]|nr:hypothetical protein [Actinomycetota bacterium]